MKKLLSILMGVGLILILVGCSSQETATFTQKAGSTELILVYTYDKKNDTVTKFKVEMKTSQICKWVLFFLTTLQMFQLNASYYMTTRLKKEINIHVAFWIILCITFRHNWWGLAIRFWTLCKIIYWSLRDFFCYTIVKCISLYFNTY